eukprot:3886355-Rhodomonas_salina.1
MRGRGAPRRPPAPSPPPPPAPPPGSAPTPARAGERGGSGSAVGLLRRREGARKEAGEEGRRSRRASREEEGGAPQGARRGHLQSRSSTPSLPPPRLPPRRRSSRGWQPARPRRDDAASSQNQAREYASQRQAIEWSRTSPALHAAAVPATPAALFAALEPPPTRLKNRAREHGLMQKMSRGWFALLVELFWVRGERVRV